VFLYTITYFNPSIAFLAILGGTRVANEICFILLVTHKLCKLWFIDCFWHSNQEIGVGIRRFFMAAAIIIGALILGYTGYVIYRKVKDVKEGKSCCGSCSSCPSKGKCNDDTKIKWTSQMMQQKQRYRVLFMLFVLIWLMTPILNNWIFRWWNGDRWE